MAVSIPQGYSMAGVYCGVKSNREALDLTLVVSSTPATAAGVYTQNLVFAAPVEYDRALTPGAQTRAVVVNSGNANACTGQRGLDDARRMAELAAGVCDAPPEAALVMSTGIIGEFLPMEKIEAGIPAVAEKLGSTDEHLDLAARGILTTDTVTKVAGRTLKIDGRTIQLTGIAKGAAMIGPNMATLLGLIMTDAALEPDVAQTALKQAMEDSFHAISVEGHTSTNDTVLLLANGQAGGEPLSGEGLVQFQAALNEVCVELARSIPADGEGASHLITLEITGCADKVKARKIAKTVAESALVKTAVTGADPNWGRIVSAAGYADVPFDLAGVRLRVNGFLLYENAAPVSFDAEEVSASMRENRETLIQLDFAEGTADTRFWTTDLTTEYIHINADYHT